MSRSLGVNTIGETGIKTIFAGDFQRVTEEVKLKGGSVYPAGAALGKITATGVCQLVSNLATDGSQVLYGILAEEVDATAGDAVGVAYLTGEFAAERIVFAPGSTYANHVVAARARSIFFRDINTAPNE